MRAVAFFEHGSADVLQYHEDFPDPVAGNNEVVIDIEYCGINHLDIWTRQGIAGKKIRLPHICGCDILGTNTKGQRVMIYPGVSCGKCQYCSGSRGGKNNNNTQENLCSRFAIIGGMSDYNGGYAECIAVPEKNVIRLPRGLKSEAAATLAVSYLTAWNMLQTNGVSRGGGGGGKKTILVYGASSGVGMATIQLAKALGATVITTVSGNSKYDFAKKLGADYIIDRTTQDIAEKVKKIVPGGVDVVIDHVGAATWPTSIAVLRQGGRMAVCGMTSGNEATVPVRAFYTKQIVMIGYLLGTKAQLHELINFVMRKKIQPVIDSIFPLQDAKEAQKKMEAGLHAGKILLKL